MKFNVFDVDPPWPFSDSLTMSSTKRGAAANYQILSIEDIKNLEIKEISEDDAVLALWCPSSLLQEGLDVMKSWGFRQTQTHVWVKIKINPFKDIIKNICKELKNRDPEVNIIVFLKNKLELFNFNDILAFGMGRLFRGCHEICLIGVKGKIYNLLENKSQRSVHFYPVTKHSEKPELLQDMLEKMFPKGKFCELFSRRDRKGWNCSGNENKSTYGEDIRDSIKRLKEAQND